MNTDHILPKKKHTAYCDTYCFDILVMEMSISYASTLTMKPVCNLM
jgi:hypothetical protein